VIVLYPLAISHFLLLTTSLAATVHYPLLRCRPTFDEGAEECTHEMAKEHNQCLIKSEEKTYLETYNCEYIKTPKPERFARAMVSDSLSLLHFLHDFQSLM